MKLVRHYILATVGYSVGALVGVGSSIALGLVVLRAAPQTLYAVMFLFFMVGPIIAGGVCAALGCWGMLLAMDAQAARTSAVLSGTLGVFVLLVGWSQVVKHYGSSPMTFMTLALLLIAAPTTGRWLALHDRVGTAD
jgi:hypothetical protein